MRFLLPVIIALSIASTAIAFTEENITPDPNGVLAVGGGGTASLITGGNAVTTEGHDDGIIANPPTNTFTVYGSSYMPDTIDIDSVREDLQAVVDRAPHSNGLCNLAAVAFSNLTFAAKANAQAKCDELTAQVNNTSATCKVVKLNNGRFRAQFRLNFQQVNQVVNVLLNGLTNFILANNLFNNAQIAVQTAVSNGCG